MKTKELARFVTSRFADLADPDKAGPMGRYMKTDMPFYGVQSGVRAGVYREMKRLFIPKSREEYEGAVLALWALPHREEKYAAIEYASQHDAWIDARSLDLYGWIVCDGAWWDFVDAVAIRLVGTAYLKDRPGVRPVMEAWVEDGDLWIRRAAILSQLKHGSETDHDQLFRFCLRRAPDTAFFIRKAIGWALREYSKTSPERVARFLANHRDRLSGLSVREGARQLVRSGFMAV